ncbi:L,D-transpeptidase [bacterium]|nr:L,D-transpeptidase [bacterium]
MKIFIKGKSLVLELRSEDKVLYSFPIKIGKNGLFKEKEGDKKTPVGIYKIIWKASVFQEDAPELRTYKIIPNQSFALWNEKKGVTEFSRTEGTKEEELWQDAYGGDEAVVFCLNYPNKKDKSEGKTGSCIEIHATKNFDKPSLGCVKLRCEEAKFLYGLVEVGTKVEITNE